MPQGISLHIGIDKYDILAYRKLGKYVSPLPNSKNDAMSVRELAKKFNFKTAIMVNNNATVAHILAGIVVAAELLEYGDMFFLSFSGHGSIARDTNHDEEEGDFDDVWCLYDGMIIDDDLFEHLKLFRPGVRILVIADCCHSGTSTKNSEEKVFAPVNSLISKKADDLQATCLLMAACQDGQVTFSSPNLHNSIYTYWLLKVLEEYNFCESYQDLHNKIVERMPKASIPNLYKLGPGAQQFAKKRPFRI